MLEPSKLTLLSDEDWESVKFKLAPSSHIVESLWPFDQFWQLRNESVSLESVNFEKLNAKQGFLFVRERGSVSVEHLSAPEYRILQKFQAGASLIAALEETQNEFSEDTLPQVGFWAVLHEIRSDYAQIMTCLFFALAGPGRTSLDHYLKKNRGKNL